MPILWRCLHFHAFFPFTQRPECLDCDAFQRAIGFLAAEGNLRLGDNANGVTMNADRYPDDDARSSKHLWMLFRSLADHSDKTNEPKVVAADLAGRSNAEDDLREVLALTQPDNLCIMPAPIEEWRPHARRVLGSSTPCLYSPIPRGDFLSLLKLILSVQLDKPEWGNHEPCYYTGRILASPDLDILQGAADATLKKSIPSETKDVDWRSFQNILSVYLASLGHRTRYKPQFQLTTTTIAWFYFTISPHFHILPFFPAHNKPSSYSARTRTHHPNPARPVPESLPTSPTNPP